jgi:cytochrome c553
MKRTFTQFAGAGFVVLSVIACAKPQEAPAAAAKPTPAEMVKRGEYLVKASACEDCHSPKVMTAQGPVPDTSRTLSGHPADSKLPKVPAGVLGPAGWGAITSGDLTAWAGPWGVSFTANLTPDETGLKGWTEDAFIQTIRNGKHMGNGRDLLPPMPWPMYRNMNDDDLRALFAYLQSLKPIKNQVPMPIPPAGAKGK